MSGSLLGGGTSGTLLLDEGSHVLDGTGTRVLDLGVVSGGVKDEGGESLDLSGGVVGGGIDLGDDDVLVVLEKLTELLVLGGEGLAVAAPGGVELNEDILGGIEDDILEGLSDDDGDGSVVGLRDGLRLDVGNEGSGLVSSEVGAEGLGGDLIGLVEDELLGLLTVLDDDSGGGSGESERLSVLGPLDSVKLDEGELGAVLLGERGDDVLDHGGLLSVLKVDEDPEEVESTVEVLGVVLGSDGSNKREGLGLDESGEVISEVVGERSVKDDVTLIEIAKNKDSGDGDLVGGGGSSISLDNSERVVVAESLGNLGVGGEVLVVDKGNNLDRLVGGESLNSGGISELGHRGLRLLDHELDDGIGLTGRVVLGVRTIGAEELEGGESTDLVLVAEVAVLGTVNGSDNTGILSIEGKRSFVVLGGEGLAVSAPGGEELNKNLLVIGNGRVKVGLVEDGNLGFSSGQSAERQDNEDSVLHDWDTLRNMI